MRSTGSPPVRDVARRSLTPLPPEKVLRSGRLAALPDSATDVKAEQWAGIFSGEQFLMFRAERQDVSEFVRKSGGLRTAAPVVLPGGSSGICAELDDPSEQPKYTPRWFRPRGIVRGRCFKIAPEASGHNWGAVAIDDDRGAVYIQVTWD
jgi:hypothetical protein